MRQNNRNKKHALIIFVSLFMTFASQSFARRGDNSVPLSTSSRSPFPSKLTPPPRKPIQPTKTVPENVTISRVVTSGSGCPDGTASVTLAPDNKSMSILFDNFVAQSDGNHLREKLQCDVVVEFAVPQGWEYSIEGVDYRGGVAVAEGSVAKHKSQFYLLNHRNGWRKLSEVSKTFNSQNSTEGNYIIHKDIKFSPVRRRICSQNTTSTMLWRTDISAQTNSKRDTSFAFISVDSIDAAQVGQKVSLNWRRCHTERD